MQIESKLRKQFKLLEFGLMGNTCVDVDLQDSYTYDQGKAVPHKSMRVGVPMQNIAASTRVFNSEMKTRKYAAIARGRERIRKDLVAVEDHIFTTMKRKGYQGHYCLIEKMPEPELKVISCPRSLLIVMWYKLGVICIKK